MTLEGKIALITGGGSGIGLATARAFIDEGATVYITGRRAEPLAQAAASLGERAIAVQADVSSPDDQAALFAAIGEAHGRLDIVFANAGVGEKAYLGQIPVEQIDRLFDINVKGVILTVQGALPLLASGGSIILNAGIIGSKGYAGWSVYSASKAAVRSLARTWSSDLKGKGIRVNVVSPGVVTTPGYARMGMSGEQLDGFFQLTADIAPLSRNGEPDEVARAVTFLASDDSRFVAGIELFVDGGAAQI
jgi:NAD(P)-dependent dehydrogenase (short-subunit alcohol dehydrogenase family)